MRVVKTDLLLEAVSDTNGPQAVLRDNRVRCRTAYSIAERTHVLLLGGMSTEQAVTRAVLEQREGLGTTQPDAYIAALMRYCTLLEAQRLRASGVQEATLISRPAPPRPRQRETHAHSTDYSGQYFFWADPER